jgi:outer membrane protein OmpA-like peptidoglycan-associated protein
MNSRLVKWVFAGAAWAALVGATSASAQDPGDVELGGFGLWEWFDKDGARVDGFAPLADGGDDGRDLEDAFGGGGRLGVFVAPNVSIEGQLSYLKAENEAGTADVTLLPFYGRLIYHAPIQPDQVSFLIGAGWVHNRFSDDIEVDEDGFNTMIGIRMGGRVVQARVEFNADYIPNPYEGFLVDAWDYNATAGLSLFLGRGPKDEDGDDVADDLDRCPGTPEDTPVDAAGCPDSDADGIFDSTDECPNTAAGVPVDAKGCPKDTDADGVSDNADKCPSTPKGATVDPAGCPKDTDLDKVFDGIDKCPNTPAGAVVDATGCTADADGDNVPDGVDKCPATPPGTAVDATGCPTLFKEGTTVVLQGVTFATGKSMLTSESQGMLDTVAETLKANPATKVEVQGHTDSTGKRATNVRLSQERADAVKNYLTSKGVGADQLTAKGYGPDQPVGDNKTADGRAQNRRVQLVKLN